jgi:hypothetical protein
VVAPRSKQDHPRPIRRTIPSAIAFRLAPTPNGRSGRDSTPNASTLWRRSSERPCRFLSAGFSSLATGCAGCERDAQPDAAPGTKLISGGRTCPRSWLPSATDPVASHSPPFDSRYTSSSRRPLPDTAVSLWQATSGRAAPSRCGRSHCHATLDRRCSLAPAEHYRAQSARRSAEVSFTASRVHTR